MDRLTLMHSFVQVAESGSFSAVARQINSTQSNVSKLIRALEDQLGVSLFARTTRKLTLTEEGVRLLPQAKQLLDRYQEVVESTRTNRAEPRGQIRFLTSDGTGRVLLLPYLQRFLERYPHIHVEHVLNDRKIDLVENHIDLAMRMGVLKDSNYKVKRIGMARRITVASTNYLKARGTPKTPEDLRHHNCITFTSLAEYTMGSVSAWEYRHPKTGKLVSVNVSGNYSSDNTSLVCTAAISGFGVYQGPNWMFKDELDNGTVKQVLGNYELEPFPLYLVYPPSDYVPMRVKVLMDFLAHELSLNATVAV
jgi:DNA-binding transcriptional LysR family regulator